MSWSKHSRPLPSNWDSLRLQMLKRDNFICVKCWAKGRPTPAFTVDHIVSRAKQGSDDPSNLQSLCKECKRVKDIEDHGGRARPVTGPDGFPVEW